MSPSPEVLFQLRVADSIVLIVLLLACSLLQAPTRQESPTTNGTSEITTVVRSVQIPRKQLIVLLLGLVALTAFLGGSVTVANAVFNHAFETKLPAWRGVEFYSIILLVAFAGAAIISLLKEARGSPIWEPKLLKLFVIVALVFDIALAVFIPLVVPIWKSRPNPGPHMPEAPEPVPPGGIAPAVHFALTVFRALILLVLSVLSFPRTVYEPVGRNETLPQTDETSLLVPAAAVASAETSTGLAAPKAKYGTFSGSSAASPSPSRSPAPAAATGGPSNPVGNFPVPTAPTWRETGTRLMRLVPYLWPSNNLGLQFLAFVCFALLGLGRVVTAAIPFQLSAVVEALSSQGASRTVLPPLLWYIALRFLGGPGGLSVFRNLLWAPVIQFSNRSLSQLAFDHLLSLSLAWHTRRKTGEVLSILDRGAAVKQIFELLLFSLLPTVADTAIAVWIFFWYFGPTMCIFIACTMVGYVSVSAVLTAQLTKLSRKMVETDITTRGIHTDSLLNYETVKYFNGEAHEGGRYREAISRFRESEIRTAGLLVGSLLIVFDTAHQDEVMKRYVVFITYLEQLYGPLNTLAILYRTVNQSLIDTERLLDLLNEPSEVQDKPDARARDNVNFSYDGRATALKGVSFTVPKGGSLALVGESGAGKTTILKLLCRFYDLAPGEGTIRIDGQDIRDITQASLRRAIGIVPQDCVLFNNSITYNIGYGKIGSSTEEIENAARAAQIHERIVSFPDGYETAVGERGVRLSGGEKQRVAIARAILKAPSIILLDEATSALDTSTERDIQKAIQNLTEGRSSVSIAHRLSTISKSDLILVFHQGEIVESGTQRELIERGGRFAGMWADQMSSIGEIRTPPDTARQDSGAPCIANSAPPTQPNP